MRGVGIPARAGVREISMPTPSRALERAEVEEAAASPRADFYRIPQFAPGQRIGLFGGTFDPPHEAHIAACLLAMKRLQLDQVWWLVTPGNPLKDTRDLAPLESRIARAREMTRHPRIVVTGLEAGIGVRFTFDTIRYLLARCPGVRFRREREEFRHSRRYEQRESRSGWR